MEVVAAVGGGAFVFVSLVLGIRLMWLSRRTRKLPEFCMGLALLLMGGVGYPLVGVIEGATALSLETRTALLVPQLLCHLVADFSFAFFTLRVFRPGVLWARALVVAITAGVVWLGLWQVAIQGLETFVLDWHVAIWRLHGIPAMAALVWGAAESLRYHALLRRRVGLGLADPVVADRMRLWGLGLIAAVVLSAVDLVLIETTGVGLVGTRFGGIVVGVLGLGAAGTIWLAFLPPDAYVRRVAARAETTAFRGSRDRSHPLPAGLRH